MWQTIRAWFSRRKQFYAWSYKQVLPPSPKSPEEEQSRGHKAQRVLKDEMYVEAYAVIETRIVGLLAQSEIVGEQRERLNALLVAHNKVKQYMEQVVLGGKMAAEQIERERTLKERMLRMVS